MTGEDRELGELCPLSPTPSPDGNIGSVVLRVLDAPCSRSCLIRWAETGTEEGEREPFNGSFIESVSFEPIFRDYPPEAWLVG